MKASYTGTLSEQIRFQRGWRTATQRKAEGWPADQVCSNCLHGWEKTPRNWRCCDAVIATAAKATCRQWEARP